MWRQLEHKKLPATKCHRAILSCTRQPSELENKERFIFFDSSWPFRPEFSHLLVWEASPSTTDSVLKRDWGSHLPLRGDISEQTSIKYDSHDFMNGSPNRDVVVFAEALQLSAGERADYLERACGADAELRQRVERLLKAHDHAGDFLEKPPP